MDSVDVVQVATPPEEGASALQFAIAAAVTLSVNVTVPVNGVGPLGNVIVAVNVTDWFTVVEAAD